MSRNIQKRGIYPLIFYHRIIFFFFLWSHNTFSHLRFIYLFNTKGSVPVIQHTEMLLLYFQLYHHNLLLFISTYFVDAVLFYLSSYYKQNHKINIFAFCAPKMNKKNDQKNWSHLKNIDGTEKNSNE